MNYSQYLKPVLLGSFFIISLISNYFVRLQHEHLSSTLDATKQQHLRLQRQCDDLSELNNKIAHEQLQHQQNVQQGFFSKPRQRDIKQLIENLASRCHIAEIFIKFEPVKYNGECIRRLPIKLTFQTDLDSDVFQLINILQQQNMGIIDIAELNIFREKLDGQNNTLNVEIRLNIINYHEPVK